MNAPPFFGTKEGTARQRSQGCTARASTARVKITVLGIKGYKQRIPLNENLILKNSKSEGLITTYPCRRKVLAVGPV